MDDIILGFCFGAFISWAITYNYCHSKMHLLHRQQASRMRGYMQRVALDNARSTASQYPGRGTNQ